MIDGQPEGAQAGTEPVYVGQTTAVQVLSTSTTPVVENVDPAAQLSAVTMQPQVTEADATVADIAEPVDGGPKVVSRSKWGADESIRCSSPDYDEFVSGATVHHTAGNNEYTKAEAPGIVRAIYTYHASTLHWCDVGYNALVDKYGTIYEGRAGGLDKPVEGAHAGGFNMNTVGIAMMGNYDKVAPSSDDPVGRQVPRLAAQARRRGPGWYHDDVLRGQQIHPVRRGQVGPPARDLRAPRCRQHRVPGGRGLREAGRDPRHRRWYRREHRARGPRDRQPFAHAVVTGEAAIDAARAELPDLCSPWSTSPTTPRSPVSGWRKAARTVGSVRR